MKIKCEIEQYDGFTRQPYWILKKYKESDEYYILAEYYNDDPNYPIGYFDAIFLNKTFKQVKEIIKKYGEAVIDNLTEDGYWIEE